MYRSYWIRPITHHSTHLKRLIHPVQTKLRSVLDGSPNSRSRPDYEELREQVRGNEDRFYLHCRHIVTIHNLRVFAEPTRLDSSL
jgi:hypothetical protein